MSYTNKKNICLKSRYNVLISEDAKTLYTFFSNNMTFYKINNLQNVFYATRKLEKNVYKDYTSFLSYMKNKKQEICQNSLRHALNYKKLLLDYQKEHKYLCHNNYFAFYTDTECIIFHNFQYDTNYVIVHSEIKNIFVFMKCLIHNIPIILTGKVGKSSIIDFMCKLFNFDLVNIFCHDETDTADLIGQFTLQDNKFMWKNSQLVDCLTQNDNKIHLKCQDLPYTSTKMIVFDSPEKVEKAVFDRLNSLFESDRKLFVHESGNLDPIKVDKGHRFVLCCDKVDTISEAIVDRCWVINLENKYDVLDVNKIFAKKVYEEKDNIFSLKDSGKKINYSNFSSESILHSAKAAGNTYLPIESNEKTSLNDVSSDLSNFNHENNIDEEKSEFSSNLICHLKNCRNSYDFISTDDLVVGYNPNIPFPLFCNYFNEQEIFGLLDINNFLIKFTDEDKLIYEKIFKQDILDFYESINYDDFISSLDAMKKSLEKNVPNTNIKKNSPSSSQLLNEKSNITDFEIFDSYLLNDIEKIQNIVDCNYLCDKTCKYNEYEIQFTDCEKNVTENKNCKQNKCEIQLKESNKNVTENKNYKQNKCEIQFKDCEKNVTENKTCKQNKCEIQFTDCEKDVTENKNYKQNKYEIQFTDCEKNVTENKNYKYNEKNNTFNSSFNISQERTSCFIINKQIIDEIKVIAFLKNRHLSFCTNKIYSIAELKYNFLNNLRNQQIKNINILKKIANLITSIENIHFIEDTKKTQNYRNFLKIIFGINSNLPFDPIKLQKILFITQSNEEASKKFEYLQNEFSKMYKYGKSDIEKKVIEFFNFVTIRNEKLDKIDIKLSRGFSNKIESIKSEYFSSIKNNNCIIVNSNLDGNKNIKSSESSKNNLNIDLKNTSQYIISYEKNHNGLQKHNYMHNTVFEEDKFINYILTELKLSSLYNDITDYCLCLEYKAQEDTFFIKDFSLKYLYIILYKIYTTKDYKQLSYFLHLIKNIIYN
ncbi:hypothetical protein EDEG_01750 [Edhazardia aedis USNM 41457]|uniref:ATPase dynein-related AAA domain-containing protein n=1 Tax=Edhazardia aedis (strain USNM 41457) TaxID=1003232 RepID=J9DRJ9_EDHAE|nr:hypothetical protein EDEG_01750 [Edhazardia aedis USNM 41457]|eukprot:EJW03957.1 hypothetical protein EDEG_01750 [Edhazardia aedis USNM 41457]